MIFPTMTKVASQELIDWLNSELRKAGVSGTSASLAAGLNRGAISSIVNGTNPGLEVCKALAGYFGRAPETVLRMAGHLPPVPPDTIDPELRHKAEELQALWRRLRDVDPESAERVMRIAVLQAEMVLAAAKAGRAVEREGEQRREKA